MTNKLTTKEFIEKAIKIHGDKYDYSKVYYTGCDNNVIIICPVHGEFKQTPYRHLKGNGCKRCACQKVASKYILTTEKFIEKARAVHGNKYDYSKVNYVNSQTKVCIICPEHGEFYCTPNNHLRGKGCPKCVGKHKTTEEFILQAKEIHGDKYDYSKTKYINATTKVCIICPVHGEFWQTPNKHLSGESCPKCKSSILETKIQRMLDENSIPYVKEYKNNFLGNQRIDFYIETGGIAIECQGRQHFIDNGYYFNNKTDNENEFLLIRKRDVLKKEKCEKQGISILYFFQQNISIDRIIRYYNHDQLYTYENSFNKIKDILNVIKQIISNKIM